MKKTNPFPYQIDNKRFHTFNYDMRTRFHHKLCKIPLDAGNTCPNRDGTKGYGGCTFCTSLGSGEFIQKPKEDLLKQYEEGKKLLSKKWSTAKTMAYFQSFTNTYAPLPVLCDMLEPFLSLDEVEAIAIATRADCLEDEKIAYLDSLCDQKEIWIELGLQSIHDETAKRIHRKHSYQEFLDCVKRLSHTRLKVCVHLINSLPYESHEMMLESAKQVGALPIHAIKLHMLHLMKNTVMFQEYQTHPFPILSREEYISLIVDQLEVIPKHIVIQRLTGDGDAANLIAPLWTKNKRSILNDIDAEFVRRDSWQGKKLEAVDVNNK